MDLSTIIQLVKLPLLEHNVSKIILFGSHSKGTAEQNSGLKKEIDTTGSVIYEADN